MQITDKELEVLLTIFCKWLGIEFSTAQHRANMLTDFIQFYNNGAPPQLQPKPRGAFIGAEQVKK